MKRNRLIPAVPFLACLAIAAVGSPGASANPGVGLAIAGGVLVQAGDPIARSTVTIVVTGAAGTSYCTGTLIAPDLILTAAHCLVDAEEISVGFNKEYWLDATGYVIHSKHNRAVNADPYDRAAHDLGLVRIGGAVPDGFAPIESIETESREREPNERLIVAGVGQDENGKLGKLKKRTVAQAGRISWGQTSIDAHHPSEGICQGDSGGPAFDAKVGKLHLVAVASQADTRCAGGWSYFTRIGMNYSFIKSGMRHLRGDVKLAQQRVDADDREEDRLLKERRKARNPT